MSFITHQLQKQQIFDNTSLAITILEEQANPARGGSIFLGEREGLFVQTSDRGEALKPAKVFQWIDHNVGMIDDAVHLDQLSNSLSRVSSLFSKKQGSWLRPNPESAEWQKGLQVCAEAAQNKARLLTASLAPEQVEGGYQPYNPLEEVEERYQSYDPAEQVEECYQPYDPAEQVEESHQPNPVSRFFSDIAALKIEIEEFLPSAPPEEEQIEEILPSAPPSVEELTEHEELTKAYEELGRLETEVLDLAAREELELAAREEIFDLSYSREVGSERRAYLEQCVLRIMTLKMEMLEFLASAPSLEE